ncbi:S49 family peptidase [Paenirhodobacter populi]|uniref:S49 family peptidase n=1 Tax=Paenirhodobacter populi TaxID=2306993 RepID=A0A443KE07_9RHOB|nr:S49 family peptidase [Sinirhodobacter populi]RWR10014.1 S49 family peptidase [Sinirhodobacter populi]RWR30945.1 S49 family peptidase [Sinirhodobacter populi]
MDILRLLPARFRPRQKRVAVLRLHGVIGATRPGAAGLSDAALAPLIERAFTRGRPDAVALLINSPGGSPVQSSLIAARIRRLADEKRIPVHAFVEDVAASGGYWLACAADDIWADGTSIVGSIGVISAGFGLDGFIDRHGIQRRVHTAGGSKSFLDPFRPEKPEDVERLTRLLEDMHVSFRDWVTSRRGPKLAEGDLFTGEVWTGRQAIATGLIDGIGHAVPKLKALYGDKVAFIPYGQRRSLLRRIGAAFGSGLGTEAAEAIIAQAEERAIRARYGL